MSNKAFGSFQGRLSLTLFISFLTVGLLALVTLFCSIQVFQQQAMQEMHKGLAQHVVKDYLAQEGDTIDLAAAKQTFHQLMFLGQNFEFYVLDTNGKVLAFSAEDPNALKRAQVDLVPLRNYLAQSRVQRPVYGDDPRSESATKVFSVAPIKQDEQLKGYLYVILGSQVYDAVAARVWNNKVFQWGLIILLAGLAFALFATLFVTGVITKPLRRLTRQVDAIQQKGLSKDPRANLEAMQKLECWCPESEHELDKLGVAFRQLVDKLNEQYQQVVTIDDLRKELLSHVSHDLRTPLASLMGYLETWELQQGKMTDDESRQYITTAKKSAYRISTLIEQLFELAHLDSGNVQVQKEQFPIAELVQDVLQKFQIQAGKRGVSLDVMPKNSAICVWGDIEKLDRVFTNLVENALRHTPDKGAITVHLFERSSMVSIEVTDTGIGIPSQDIPHIFDPHFKAQNSVRENTAHGGLGLAITKKILDLHQTTIAVRSSLNEGTTFSFTLHKSA
ncbi:HAMP domain-containing sensor histidine kinase [Neptunomonas sp. XY-337]|uniref:sensor histidine kinase n=1 Tax=Neptunomonas sp. XY-337 TaxID=2561897 RepID=UPI0010AADA3F|nr:HAMP domain-containing sensor histidine kinase [Neptunomonas sp. XY-337]